MQPGKALTRPHQLILRFCRPAEALVESHCLPPIVPQGGRFVNAALVCCTGILFSVGP